MIESKEQWLVAVRARVNDLPNTPEVNRELERCWQMAYRLTCLLWVRRLQLLGVGWGSLQYGMFSVLRSDRVLALMGSPMPLWMLGRYIGRAAVYSSMVDVLVAESPSAQRVLNLNTYSIPGYPNAPALEKLKYLRVEFHSEVLKLERVSIDLLDNAYFITVGINAVIPLGAPFWVYVMMPFFDYFIPALLDFLTTRIEYPDWIRNVLATPQLGVKQTFNPALRMLGKYGTL